MRVLRWTAAKARSPIHETFVEVIVLGLGALLTFKKLTSFSLTQYGTRVLAPLGVPRSVVETGVIVLAYVCLYAVLAKLLLVALEKLKIGPLPKGAFGRLAQCCITVRDDDEKELEVLTARGGNTLRLAERRKDLADVHIVDLIGRLAEHLCATIPKCEEDDLFISVYAAEPFTVAGQLPMTLRLSGHHPRRDGGEVVSHVIDVGAERFAGYECVKAINSGARKAVALSDCKKYFRSNTDRHRRIQHYLGMPLMGCDRIIGFLNIEFSNHLFFVSDNELREYMTKNILGYKYLLEHHLLRAEFNVKLLEAAANKTEG
ncbi:hypothetical protein ACQ86G_08540 [Roseateles chitinivorans]|uniref:hypothetical protein n=1 Tax=Roseateles chitinivorans TaxID=2917965 RepID=UPI003D671490